MMNRDRESQSGKASGRGFTEKGLTYYLPLKIGKNNKARH